MSRMLLVQGTQIIQQSMQNMDSTVRATIALNGRVGLFTYEDKTTVFPEYEYLADTPECQGMNTSPKSRSDKV